MLKWMQDHEADEWALALFGAGLIISSWVLMFKGL